MKAKDMRAKSHKELEKQLADAEGNLMQAHVDYRSKEVKNVKLIASLKRDIARAKTILHEQSKQSEGDQS